MRVLMICSLLAVVALASPAFAEKAPDAKAVGHETKSADPHGASGGHENKNALAEGLKRYDLGIYTLIVFGLLIAILGKYAWPNISAGLKKREAAILGAREEAAKSKAEAEELRVKLQKDFAEAQDKIRAMLDEARRDSEALRASERDAGAKEAQAERDRARREIQTEKDAALQELYQQAVQLASLMSSKTIRRELSAEDHRKLLDESLAEIRGSVKA